jgi:hypothetical protein
MLSIESLNARTPHTMETSLDTKLNLHYNNINNAYQTLELLFIGNMFSNFNLCIMWTTLDPVHDGVVIRASLNLHMTFIIHAIFNSFLTLDLMIRFGFDFPPLYLKLNFGRHGTSPKYNEIFVCTNINLHITIILHRQLADVDWLSIHAFGLPAPKDF